METMLRPRSPRGIELLLEHCAAFVYSDDAHPDEARQSPFERVEAAVGWELAHRLLQALSGDYARVPRHLLV